MAREAVEHGVTLFDPSRGKAFGWSVLDEAPGHPLAAYGACA